MDENVRFTGDKEDSWKRDFWTARNPNTGQKITESTIDRGTDTISNRFVYPSGQWTDYITGERGQLTGPQTWDYDPASWTGDTSGIMELENKYNIEDYSPDGQGRWMTESPWGQKVLSGLVNKFAPEGSSEYLQDAIGGGGFPLDILGYKGYIRPTWEDGNVGFLWSSGG